MQTSPVDHARSGAPFLAVAGLCAIGVSLLIAIVMLLNSALVDPDGVGAVSPNGLHSGPGVTLQPQEPKAEPKGPAEAPAQPTLVALGPPAPASEAAIDTDLPDVTRVDNVDFPRGKKALSSKDKKDGFFDGDVGHRQLASKKGSTDSADGKGPQGNDHGRKSHGQKNNEHGKSKSAAGPEHGKASKGPKHGKGPQHGKGHGRGKGRNHGRRSVG